jgi:hypothetical protein
MWRRIDAMNRRAPLPPYLSELAKLRPERIAYYAEADDSLIETIQHGVLFVIAHWSIYAVQAWAAVTDILSKFDPAGRLEFVVVDIDGIQSPRFGGMRIGGYGELAFIYRGTIVAASFDEPHQPDIRIPWVRERENIRWLLSLGEPDTSPADEGDG